VPVRGACRVLIITVVIYGVALAHSKLTAQGQVSVPAKVRQRLGVGPGSILEWDEDGDRVVVRKAGRYSSEDIHRALFSGPPDRRSLGEMKAGVRQAVMRRHARR
jgi:antitoxin PrlF